MKKYILVLAAALLTGSISCDDYRGLRSRPKREREGYQQRHKGESEDQKHRTGKSNGKKRHKKHKSQWCQDNRRDGHMAGCKPLKRGPQKRRGCYGHISGSRKERDCSPR